MSSKTFIQPPAMAELPQPETIDASAILDSYIKGETDLVCILGPTASGKTRYAVAFAREINRLSGKAVAEIISADSRQVYRGMDIGTVKDMGEYGEIPVHLVDIADPGSKYNIYEYQRDFEKVYKDIRERGGVPILCGGSGLYIEAATCGYSLPDVPADPKLRAELEKHDTEDLIKLLASLKPLHNSTDYDTRKRLIRALEIAIYAKEHPVERTAYLPKKTYYIGTLVSREVRNSKIDARLKARLEEGMVQEIRSLMDGTNPALPKDENGKARAVPAEDLLYYGLEYKFVTLHIQGVLSLEEMTKLLAIAIHQFAKRQMTWFRGMERKGIRIHWVNVC